jgi:hypothetical protein
MTLPRHRPQAALPNVLRNQTVPNTLGDRHAEPAQVARLTLPWRPIAIAVAGLIVLASFLTGRS